MPRSSTPYIGCQYGLSGGTIPLTLKKTVGEAWTPTTRSAWNVLEGHYDMGVGSLASYLGHQCDIIGHLVPNVQLTVVAG